MAARSRSVGATQAARGVRPFTGHLFCSVCGSACYSRPSKNAKGAYQYYNCGLRQRKGPKACPNAGSIREDHLVDLVTGICSDILADADAVIAAATKIGLKRLDAGRLESLRLQNEIANLDAQSISLMKLMMNPAIVPEAMTAFSRQIGEKEAERKKMEHRLAQTALAASEGVERFQRSIRIAYRRACENFAQILSGPVMNRFVEEFIGPMALTSDGRVEPRSAETTTASAEAEAVVNGSVAGGGFEPPTSGL